MLGRTLRKKALEVPWMLGVQTGKAINGSPARAAKIAHTGTEYRVETPTQRQTDTWGTSLNTRGCSGCSGCRGKWVQG